MTGTLSGEASKTNTTLTVDLHTHSQTVMPRWLRAGGELLLSMPSEPLANLARGRVNVAVVAAVGDPIGTLWQPRSAWAALMRQLATARKEAHEAGMEVILSAEQLTRRDRSAIVLGIEGADLIGQDPMRLEPLHQVGVRVIGLVHYADNNIGTIGASLLGKRQSWAIRSGRRRAGLTSLGRELVSEMNRLGILVDLAHADRATTVAACENSHAPVVSSHTGASAIQQFPRYISDEEAEAIASTGGLIGLWPMGFRGVGMVDLDDFARHASHLAELVGTRHLCIGTDMNGVPGYLREFSSSRDIRALTARLLKIGFSPSDVEGIAGGNAARVLHATMPRGGPTI